MPFDFDALRGLVHHQVVIPTESPQQELGEADLEALQDRWMKCRDKRALKAQWTLLASRTNDIHAALLSQKHPRLLLQNALLGALCEVHFARYAANDGQMAHSKHLLQLAARHLDASSFRDLVSRWPEILAPMALVAVLWNEPRLLSLLSPEEAQRLTGPMAALVKALEIHGSSGAPWPEKRPEIQAALAGTPADPMAIAECVMGLAVACDTRPRVAMAPVPGVARWLNRALLNMAQNTYLTPGAALDFVASQGGNPLLEVICRLHPGTAHMIALDGPTSNWDIRFLLDSRGNKKEEWRIADALRRIPTERLLAIAATDQEILWLAKNDLIGAEQAIERAVGGKARRKLLAEF